MRHNSPSCPGSPPTGPPGALSASRARGPMLGDDGPALAWGRPLAVAAGGAAAVAAGRAAADPNSAGSTLLAILAAFWLLTAVQRAGIGQRPASRYIYVGASSWSPLGVELVRGSRSSRRAWQSWAERDGAIASPTSATDEPAAVHARAGAAHADGLAAFEIARPWSGPITPTGDPRLPVHGGPRRPVLRRWSATSARRPLASANYPPPRRPPAAPPTASSRDPRVGLQLQGPRRDPGGARRRLTARPAAPPRRGGCVASRPATGNRAGAELKVPANGVGCSRARAGRAELSVRPVRDDVPRTAPVGTARRGRSRGAAITLRPVARALARRMAPAARPTACGR